MARHLDRRRRREGEEAPNSAPAARQPLPASGAAHEPSFAAVRALQPAGNHAVQRAARAISPAATPASTETRTQTRTERMPLRTEIRRGPPPGPAAEPAAGRLDSPAGEHAEPEQQILELEEATRLPDETPAGPAPGGGAGGSAPAAAASPAPAQAEAGAAPEGEAGATPEGEGGAAPEAEGRSFRLPDVEVPALAQLSKCDLIAAGLGYSGSITRGGAQPNGFGVTRSFSSRLTNIVVTPLPKVFAVTAVLEHPITWQVRSGTGPNGQLNISSAADPKITAANHAAVADDLEPVMSDLNGRPKRDAYWAEDLTERHELVHAADDHGNGPAATVQVMGWLMQQTASSAADVQALLGRIPSRFASALLAALSTEDGERHAYGDGAPRYRARAELIRDMARRGVYS